MHLLWRLWRFPGASGGGLSPASPPRPVCAKSGPPAPSSSPSMPGNPPISLRGSISSDDSDMGSNSKAMSSGTAQKMNMCNSQFTQLHQSSKIASHSAQEAALFLPISQSIFNSRSGVPFLSFHVFGPLTAYPKTKSAAADGLEKSISSVVTKFSTLPDSITFLLKSDILAFKEGSLVFSLITAPFLTTNPSVVSRPSAFAFPIARCSAVWLSASDGSATGSSTLYPSALMRIFNLSIYSSITA